MWHTSPQRVLQFDRSLRKQRLARIRIQLLDEHKPIIPEAPKQHNANTGEYYAPPADGNSNATNQNQGENQPTQMPFPTIQTIQFDIPEYKEQGEIDGVNINDIAATIRTNPQRFIEKFKGFSAKKAK